jgi:hypothetical protein
VIDAQRAARLAHLLTSLARLIEVTDFERRLAEIEAALEQQQAERQQRQRRPNGHHPSPALAFTIAFLVGVLVGCARPDPVEVARIACADYGLAPDDPRWPACVQAEVASYRAARAALGSAMIMSRPTVTVRPAPLMTTATLRRRLGEIERRLPRPAGGDDAAPYDPELHDCRGRGRRSR